ncbi:hypothetical protein QBZ16_003979 [Prototheca wickerhamii]|uniref:Reticulon-like protein n=1 Tax=Prototheca wickerhamii TaxID=3111 RepID=A0AAD9IGQ4_PROWI|nr:hypothetical protein QBZ16_003979 [Prototheca wickerhamii]
MLNSITEASRSFAIPAYRDDLEEEDVDGDVSMLGTTPMETRTLRFTSSLEPATREISARAELGGADIMRDLLLYDNPMLSGLVAVLGLAVLALGHYLLSGSHGWRLVPTLSHAALCVVAFNMFRGLLVRGWTSDAAGSGAASAAAELAAAAVCGAAGLYDAYLASPDAAVSLRSVLALWGLARLGGVVGLWTTLSILFVGAFTVPVALATFEAQISELRALIGGSVQARWSALGLTRRQKGLALVLSVAGLWSLVSWPTRLTAVLAGALAIRANLRPTEVEAIMSHAAPYTQSVQKRARRLSIAAAGFASSRLGRHVKPRQL